MLYLCMQYKLIVCLVVDRNGVHYCIMSVKLLFLYILAYLISGVTILDFII